MDRRESVSILFYLCDGRVLNAYIPPLLFVDSSPVCSPSHHEEINMAELIDRNKAIEILEKIKKDKESKTCSRSNIYQAQALGYAIAVLKKIPTYEKE